MLEEFDGNKIKIILGLGNPGDKYKETYHNAGRIILDSILGKAKLKEYQNCNYIKISEKWLATTTDFINESGRAVTQLLKLAEANPEELLVIHDDSDLILGQWKLEKGRGAAGHNGVKSIIEVLGNQEFWRWRVGIRKENPERRVEAAEFVLNKINPEDKEWFQELGAEVKTKLKLNDTLLPT